MRTAARGFSPETMGESVPPDPVRLLREHLGGGVATFEDARTDPACPPASGPPMNGRASAPR